MSCQESGAESRRDKHDISCIWADNIRLAHLSDKRGRTAVFRSNSTRLWDESKCFPFSVYQDVPLFIYPLSFPAVESHQD